MKFNIMGFNQKLLVKNYSALNGNDLIVLRTLVDILPRMTRTIEVEGKEFKQVTYELLLEDIPFVTQSTSTLKKIVQKFIDAKLIERHIQNKGGKFTYFKTTEALENLKFKEEVAIDETKKLEAKKKTSKKKKEDDGQFEAFEYAEKVDLVNEIITIGTASQELKDLVVTKTLEEIKEVVGGVKANNNGVINSTYILNAFNKPAAKECVNPLKFNNFEAREYNYEALENKLLGWDNDYSEEAIHEVLSYTRKSNYTSNNSKRFNGIEIGV